jgi:copper chaperone
MTAIHDETPGMGSGATVTVRVEDMTCGHCAGVIRAAIEGAVPGARVTADPASKLVSIEGADRGTVEAVIAEAGYTPSPAGA